MLVCQNIESSGCLEHWGHGIEQEKQASSFLGTSVSEEEVAYISKELSQCNNVRKWRLFDTLSNRE